MDETPIRVVEYDPEWAEAFERERRRIEAVVGEYTDRIEHVGTSILERARADDAIEVPEPDPG